jgi:hypothetical protein
VVPVSSPLASLPAQLLPDDAVATPLELEVAV